MKQTILQKLTSRKFWFALSLITSGLVLIFGFAESDAETIAGAVLSIGGAVSYMIAEGIVDAKNVGKVLEGAELIIHEITDGADEEANDETNREDGESNGTLDA